MNTGLWKVKNQGKLIVRKRLFLTVDGDVIGMFVRSPGEPLLLLCLEPLGGCRVMIKFLLLIALGIVVWWMWRKSQARDSAAPRPPAQRAAERMVKCAYCGVNQPVSESLLANGHYYCCTAHRQTGESATEGD